MMKRLLCLYLFLLPSIVSAAPLMTEEYPLWVQDAVKTLRQQGLISAGCLTDQALTRGDLSPLLNQIFQRQEAEEARLASKSDLHEIRHLMETLMQGANHLNQQVDQQEIQVDKHNQL